MPNRTKKLTKLFITFKKCTTDAKPLNTSVYTVVHQKTSEGYNRCLLCFNYVIKDQTDTLFKMKTKNIWTISNLIDHEHNS